MRTPLPLCSLSRLLGGFGVRHLLPLLLGVFSSFVFAQSAGIRWLDNSAGGPYYSADSTTACIGLINRQAPGNNYQKRAVEAGAMPGLTAQCQISGNGTDWVPIGTVGAQCSEGATWNSTLGSCQGANPCADGAGQSSEKRFTVGYARSNNPNNNDYIPPFSDPSGTTSCDGQCMENVQTAGADAACYRSQQPASNGLHRISCNFLVTKTGQQCPAGSPADPRASPSAAPPPCPGQMGTVNGNPVCFGTPAAPLPQTPRPGGLPPEQPGNPAAGPRPTTGTGSGSSGTGATPPSGNGGSEGGGSNAAVPGGGSSGNGQGTGSSSPLGPDGLPTSGSGSGTGGTGGEKIGVDEAGMPSGSGAYDAATGALNANKDSAIQGINSAAGSSGKNTSWSFTFAFPTGCSPIPLAAFDPYLTGVDICQWRDEIHDLMAMAWLAATVFLCIGMVGRAVGGGSS